jgi:biopolymer transport protein ExbD
MNMLVVLAPFLLVTAVFTKLSVLEIYLPPAVSAEAMQNMPTPGEQLSLTLSITENGLLVSNGDKVISLVTPSEKGPDLETLSGILQQLKSRFPEVENAIVLSKAHIPYDTLIQVMDTTRVALVTVEGKKTRVTLFPNISLGEVQ